MTANELPPTPEQTIACLAEKLLTNIFRNYAPTSAAPTLSFGLVRVCFEMAEQFERTRAMRRRIENKLLAEIDEEEKEKGQ